MNLEKYRWKSRILFVSTPNFKEESYQKVKKYIKARLRNFIKDM